MKIRLFDPTLVKPEDYRHRYPELDRIPEFKDLTARALIFVWWYANPTSELLLETPDDYERASKALAKSGFVPSKTEREGILRLQFDDSMSAAIKRMSNFDPGARFKSYIMIKKIFDQYQSIVDKGPDAFQTIEGSGENMVVINDFPKYVNISAKIAEELPTLLVKLEEGFGVVDVSGKDVEDDADGSSSIRDWHMSKKENT